MKALRSICILVLVAGLVLASVGSVFAESSTGVAAASHPNPVVRALLWRAFFGNVTGVNGGNVTIATKHSGDVVVALTGATRCEIMGETGWINLSEFTTKLGGNLSALEGKSVAVVAINVQGPSGGLTGDAVLFVVMEPVSVMPIHQTTGVVTDFSPGPGGNISIRDMRGATYEFTIGNDTRYSPAGMGPGNITVNHTFVTVVSRGELNAQPVAKMILIHNMIPQGWLRQWPNPGINKPGIPRGNITIPPIHIGVLAYHEYIGNVTSFVTDSIGNGNITIKDIHGTSYEFSIIGNETRYGPAGTGPGNITVGILVTVVSKSEPNAQPVAEMITLYKGMPRRWPTPPRLNLGTHELR
jgi:hypothetical protein